MLTEAQLNYLKDCINDNFEVIRDYDDFNLGIKVLFLERAIEQDCDTFLKTLDKIYDRSNIEFVRSLKFINDIFFNNEVKNEDYGVKLALVRYFSTLGSIDVADFQKAIREILISKLGELRLGQEQKISAQKSERECSEADLKRLTRWRKKLDLPVVQRGPEASDFDILVEINLNRNPIQFIGQEQYEQLSEKKRQLITYSAVQASILLALGVTVEDFQSLPDAEFEQLFLNIRNFYTLIAIIEIPLFRFLESHGDIRAQLLNYADFIDQKLEYLLKDKNYYFEDLSEFLKMVCDLRQNEVLIEIANLTGVPLQYLLTLEGSIREAFVRQPNAIGLLCNENKITPQDLASLELSLLEEFLRHADQIFVLVCGEIQYISFEALCELEPGFRRKLFELSEDFIALLVLPGFSLEDLQSLDPEHLFIFLEISNGIVKLHKAFGCTFQDLKDVQPEDLYVLSETAEEIIKLSVILNFRLNDWLSLESDDQEKLLEYSVVMNDLAEAFNIDLEYWLEIDLVVRDQLLASPYLVIYIIKVLDITFEEWIEFDSVARLSFMANTETIIRFSQIDKINQDRNISARSWANLTVDVRHQLINHKENVIKILKNVKDISQETFLALPLMNRALLLNNVQAVINLTEKDNVPFLMLIAREIEEQQEVLAHANSTVILVGKRNISLDALLSLRRSLREECFYFPRDIAQLVDEGAISFISLMNIPRKAIREKLYSHADVVSRLVESGNVSSDDLPMLSIEELNNLLCETDSEGTESMSPVLNYQ